MDDFISARPARFRWPCSCRSYSAWYCTSVILKLSCRRQLRGRCSSKPLRFLFYWGDDDSADAVGRKAPRTIFCPKTLTCICRMPNREKTTNSSPGVARTAVVKVRTDFIPQEQQCQKPVARPTRGTTLSLG